MSRPRTHGVAGAAPRRLARRRSLAAAAVLATAALLAAALAAAGAGTAMLAVVVVGWAGFRMLRSGAVRARAGAQAEVDVAAALRRAGATAVVYNARLPGCRGDVDAVVLGPMAAAIEVKRATGRVRCYADGRVRVAGRMLPGRPLRQAIAAAVAVRRTLGLEGHVTAIVCITGMRRRPRLVTVSDVPVWVASPRHLRRVLRRLPRLIGRTEAREAAHRLR